MFPENFDWLNLIQSPKVPSDGMFYLWPTWLTSMFLGHFVHHLHQAVEITKPKEFILLGLLESFRLSLSIVKLFVTLCQWIHQWSYKALYVRIS